MNFEKIKAEAKKRNCTVPDLFVLSRSNDPFYIGTDSQKRDGQWFAEIWNKFGYAQKEEVHLRRVHYRLVSQNEPVIMPCGMPYTNTEKCWTDLNNASKFTRYLKIVDATKFDDRRNGKPQIFFNDSRFTPSIHVDINDEWRELSLPDLPDLPGYYLDGFTPEQPYHLEIWCEKSTMNDILLPLCRRYNVNLVTGLGELSLTTCLWLVERVKESRKPCRVLYISDFDPAGQSMPVAAARKIEKFVHDYGTPDMDIKLIPVALTHEQCRAYKLPRTPIKESERRAGKFESRYGEGATELDALEALHEGELNKILTGEILKYYDSDLTNKVRDIREQAADDTDRMWRQVVFDYQNEINTIQGDYEIIREQINEQIQDIQERWQNVCHRHTQ